MYLMETSCGTTPCSERVTKHGACDPTRTARSFEGYMRSYVDPRQHLDLCAHGIIGAVFSSVAHENLHMSRSDSAFHTATLVSRVPYFSGYTRSYVNPRQHLFQRPLQHPPPGQVFGVEGLGLKKSRAGASQPHTPTSGLAPAPHTLHLTPYTMQVTPYTLHLTQCRSHPTPYTLQKTSHTLHPTPYKIQVTPYTLHLTQYKSHPTPYTLHNTRHTLDPRPYTLHRCHHPMQAPPHAGTTPCRHVKKGY
jgi:hypothetical protein